jgi:hypothetical protein
MGRYTLAVSGQQLGKHILIATDTNATVLQQQAVATHWRGKHVSAATNPDTTIEDQYT